MPDPVDTPDQSTESIIASVFEPAAAGAAPQPMSALPGMPSSVKSGTFTPEPPAPEPPAPEPLPQIVDAPPPPAAEKIIAPSDIPDLELPAPSEGDTPPIPGDDAAANHTIVEKYAFQSREDRRLRKAAEQRVAELEAAQAGPDAADVEQLRAQVQTLENELGRENLAKSTAFREEYEAPIGTIHAQALNLLTRAGAEQGEAEAALDAAYATPDLRQRELALEELGITPSLTGAVLQMTLDRDNRVEARENALAAWRNSRAAVQERSSREQLARSIQEAKTLTSEAVKAAQAQGNPYFTKVEGNQAWDGTVQHFTEALQSVLERNNPSEIAGLVANGLTHPELFKQFASERQRRQALEQESFGGGGSANPSSATPTASPAARRASGGDQPLSNAEAISKVFGR